MTATSSAQSVDGATPCPVHSQAAAAATVAAATSDCQCPDLIVVIYTDDAAHFVRIKKQDQPMTTSPAVVPFVPWGSPEEHLFVPKSDQWWRRLDQGLLNSWFDDQETKSDERLSSNAI